MAQAHLDGSGITDWNAFHTRSAESFGFPSFYERNMNAWIDCLTYVREGDGMSRFALGPEEPLVIEVRNADAFEKQAREIFTRFVACVAFVNRRHVAAGEKPALHILFL